jgi:hypothetical protein
MEKRLCAALQDAQDNYKTQKASGFQVVVSNGYAKVSESMLSLSRRISRWSIPEAAIS